MEEHGDMTEARSYMQRGLRFCKNKKTMWIQYARLEMSYIAKIHARRQILGIEAQDDTPPQVLAADKSITSVAELAVESIQHPEESEVDATALSKLETIPVQSGAIPVAVFDGAMAQFNNDPSVAELFVEMLSDYDDIPAARQIFQHIANALGQQGDNLWARHACEIQMLVVGIPTSSVEYPSAFREALRVLKEARAKNSNGAGLNRWAQHWLQKLLEDEDLDPALQTVARAVCKSIEIS